MDTSTQPEVACGLNESERLERRKALRQRLIGRVTSARALSDGLAVELRLDDDADRELHAFVEFEESA